MELQVRNARITDVDGITSLLAGMSGHDASRGSEADADLLRSLIYLPNATVIVAADGRRVIAAAVLALRPSVFHGGHVGTIDLIAIDAEADERIIDRDAPARARAICPQQGLRPGGGRHDRRRGVALGEARLQARTAASCGRDHLRRGDPLIATVPFRNNRTVARGERHQPPTVSGNAAARTRAIQHRSHL